MKNSKLNYNIIDGDDSQFDDDESIDLNEYENDDVNNAVNNFDINIYDDDEYSVKNKKKIKINKIMIKDDDDENDQNKKMTKKIIETNNLMNEENDYEDIQIEKNKIDKSEENQKKEEKNLKKNIKLPIKKINHFEVEEDEDNNNYSNCSENRLFYLEIIRSIKILNNKIENIENEVKEIKKILSTKKQMNFAPTNRTKIDINAWLNSNVFPSMSFDDFVENLKVNLGHFEYLMDYKLADTIQKIILFNITKRDDDFIYPIYSSIEKQNKVFVYDNDEDIWKIIDITSLNKFVKKIQDELNKYSVIWKAKNKNNCNAECSSLCQQAIRKLNTISYTQDQLMNRVRYDLRVQLQSVCNYGFL